MGRGVSVRAVDVDGVLREKGEGVGRGVSVRAVDVDGDLERERGGGGEGGVSSGR